MFAKLNWTRRGVDLQLVTFLTFWCTLCCLGVFKSKHEWKLSQNITEVIFKSRCSYNILQPRRGYAKVKQEVKTHPLLLKSFKIRNYVQQNTEIRSAMVIDVWNIMFTNELVHLVDEHYYYHRPSINTSPCWEQVFYKSVKIHHNIANLISLLSNFVIWFYT